MITQSAILCPTLPKNRQLCLVALKSFADVLELLKQVKLQLSDIVNAVEFIDGASMRMVNEQLAIKNPLNKNYEFYALVEVGSSNEGAQNEERLFGFLSSAENLVIVWPIIYKPIFRMELYHKMSLNLNLFGALERK